MDDSKREKPTFEKRSVSLRSDQWAEIERVAIDEAKHGMVSRTLQDVIDRWVESRKRAGEMAAVAS